MFLLIGSDWRRPSDMEIELPSQMSEKMSASLKCGRRPFDYFHSGWKDCRQGIKLWITWRAIFVSHCLKHTGLLQRITAGNAANSAMIKRLRNKWSVKWLPALQSISCSRLYEVCKTVIFAYGQPVLFIHAKSQLRIYTSGQKHHYKNFTMARKTGEF